MTTESTIELLRAENQRLRGENAQLRMENSNLELALMREAPNFLIIRNDQRYPGPWPDLPKRIAVYGGDLETAKFIATNLSIWRTPGQDDFYYVGAFWSERGWGEHSADAEIRSMFTGIRMP